MATPQRRRVGEKNDQRLVVGPSCFGRGQFNGPENWQDVGLDCPVSHGRRDSLTGRVPVRTRQCTPLAGRGGAIPDVMDDRVDRPLGVSDWRVRRDRDAD